MGVWVQSRVRGDKEPAQPEGTLTSYYLTALLTGGPVIRRLKGMPWR